MTNISEFLSKVILPNSCLSVNSTHLVIGKSSAVLYILQVKFPIPTCISILLRDRKGIPKATFILVSASKKVSSKNRILLYLSQTKNPTIVIQYIFSTKLSIFCMPTFVDEIEKPNLAANAGVIAFILLLESINTLSRQAWN